MPDFNNTTSVTQNFQFLASGGEMGQLMRSKDWSQSHIGTPDTWPQSLRTTLSIILNSKFPMFLFWGPELICFYNDAYRPSLGEKGKHPAILGSRGEDYWQEIWPSIKPLIDEVLAGGEASWSEDQLLPIYRNGKMEDVYWTFSYSPVNDESNKPAGVFVTCSETTDKIIIHKKLEESKGQLQFAIDAAELGTWDYNPVTNKFVFNQRLKDWFGLPSGTEIDLEIAVSSIAEKDRERVAAAIRHSLDFTSGGKYDIEYTIVNLVTKKEKIVQAKGRAWFDENKIATRFNGTLQDVTEQAMVRKRMEETDQRFRNTVKQAPVGITILRGNDFIVEMANDAYLELVDRKGAFFEGKPLFDSLPEVEETVRQLLENVLKTGHPFHGIEYPIPINRYGKQEVCYFDFLYHPLKEEDGEISGIIVTATDVSESVKAKHFILESEKQFRNMVMQSPIPMTIIRGAKHIIEMANNVMFDDVWRKKENDVVGRSILEVFPELNEQKYPELLNEVFTTGKTHSEKESIAYVQGDDGMKKFYLDFEYAPLFEKDNSISGIIITVNDVTEKVEARIIIEESEKEFRQLADSLPELVWTTDSLGIQTFASQRWKEFTGLDPYDGTAFEKMIHPDDLQNILSVWRNSLATGNIYKAQARIKSKDGDYQWFYVNGEPIRDANGTIEKWIGAFTNFNDQKKAEEKFVNALLQIEESEKRFRDVANTAPVFIWMADIHKKRTFFNAAWLNFTGRNLEQEVGDGWTESVHPDDMQKCLDNYLKAFENKEEYNFEYRLKRYDGEYRWISARGVPRFSSSDLFEGFIGACMDIHERVMHQKKLKEDEERLNIVIEASDLGTWELNLENDEFHYSERFLEIFGVEKNRVIEHNEILSYLSPEDLSIRKKAFLHAYETGVLQYISRVIWSDQSTHWIENRGKVFYSETNIPQKLIGTTRDITEEKNYQQELQQREEKFRLLADSMPQFIWTGDAEGNLNYFNQAVYAYSGLTPEQMEKEGWLQIVHPDDREENVTAWLHSINTGTDFIFEHRFGRFDGEYRWQLSRAIPQRDAAGNIQMWVGTSTDIQEIKEQEQQKDFFISMASHELKTPVTSIKGYVQLLQSTYGNSEDHFLSSSLRVIDKQIVNLTDLIADLLDVSKIKSGSLLLDREDFEMNEMLQEVVNGIKHVNPDYSIQFSAETSIRVNADKSRMGQVLINFLTNAVKYSPASKTVIVKSFVKDGYAVVTVQDSGIGMSKADQAKIFDRFYRVEGKNEKTFPGFGIGLFIASEIIHKHFGKIGVTSEPGKGSVFYFSIPVIK